MTLRGTAGMGTSSFCPLPCSSERKSPAQPDGCISPAPHALCWELLCSPGCLLLPHPPASFSFSFYPKSPLMYFKPISSILSRAAMAGSSPPSFGSSPQAGEGQETSSASSAVSEWDCGQGDLLRRASALHFGHSICPTSPPHIPNSPRLLPLPKSPLTVTAWRQWHWQLVSNSALKVSILHSRLSPALPWGIDSQVG